MNSNDILFEETTNMHPSHRPVLPEVPPLGLLSPPGRETEEACPLLDLEVEETSWMTSNASTPSKANHKPGPKKGDKVLLGKPKHPLNAYNLFFYICRQRLLYKRCHPDEDLEDDEEEEGKIISTVVTEADIARYFPINGHPPPPAPLSRMPTQPSTTGTAQPHPHPLVHSFRYLGQFVGQEWRRLDANSLSILKRRARLYQDEYRRAMEVWRCEMARLAPPRPPKKTSARPILKDPSPPPSKKMRHVTPEPTSGDAMPHYREVPPSRVTEPLPWPPVETPPPPDGGGDPIYRILNHLTEKVHRLSQHVSKLTTPPPRAEPTGSAFYPPPPRSSEPMFSASAMSSSSAPLYHRAVDPVPHPYRSSGTAPTDYGRSQSMPRQSMAPQSMPPHNMAPQSMPPHNMQSMAPPSEWWSVREWRAAHRASFFLEEEEHDGKPHGV